MSEFPANFKAVLHESLAPIAGGVGFDEQGTLRVDSIDTLRCLIRGLRSLGYLVLSLRRDQRGLTAGIMDSMNHVPSFFELQFKCPAPLPETKGLFLAFLGPDGVGKTTTVKRVMDALDPAFSRMHLFHWRPQVLKPRTADDEANGRDTWTSINRHGDPPRGLFLSLLRLGGVFADYYLGHLKVVSPALDRGELVVFDRYYHDILVDSRRYRYGGPDWLLHTLKHLLPQREVLFVVLDADDSIILSRKQEVSPAELREQRQRYAELAASLANCLSIRTDIGEAETVRQVLHAVGFHLAKRVERALGLPIEMTESLATSKVKAEGKLA